MTKKDSDGGYSNMTTVHPLFFFMQNLISNRPAEDRIIAASHKSIHQELFFISSIFSSLANDLTLASSLEAVDRFRNFFE
jgi:hypothetical protein